MIEQVLPLVILGLVLVALFAWLLHELGRQPSLLRQLGSELRSRLPVYSAETVQGREAEFIRDRLPRKLARTLALMLALLVLMLALFWWVTR